jgi:hypothetical protein
LSEDKPGHQPALPGLDWQDLRPPPEELLRTVRAYVGRVHWIFAKTMADNPHFYVVLFHQQGANRDGYLALRELIVKYGWNRRWHGRTWRTYTLDDHDYWHIHPVVNRKPSENAGWDS